ncbi:carbon-nitrogen hydrolase family protein [Kribbella sp. CA-293567]|uniref:carbon-nitrogen hydrolase family protein n=1 Tax=Kribbella sp. CA-293567 TaxID=3002436 RepID=UPI0022DE027C|nr:carbon-nitrogen hydrolase family protein [Kribbella sp. CA-293567]WBQ02760.1 carbon-nitrogen hydrolase family protein [Kribbella sp. CA-293567]
MTSLRVAAGQLSTGADPVANLAIATESVRQAAEAGASLVALPEATLAAFGSDLGAVAEPLDGPFATGLRKVAAELGVVVIAGLFEPADDGRVHNTLLATGPGVEAAYRKIHLYDAFGSRESDLVAPGKELVTIEVGGVRVGLATCYDLRFAEQFTALGRAGAELIVVPASWGAGPSKEDQWDLLTRARASDAQSWLLACDQAWTPPRGTNPLGIGRSALIDPLGHPRARLGAEPDLLTGTIHTELTAAVRLRVPIL